jgi:ADP-heptose:LPS heptosyltransferase
MDRPENILLVRLKSIGDVLFALPAVHTVRENFPDARITFLTARENAPLLEGFREVNEVMALDRALFQTGNPFAIVPEAFSLLRCLRRGKFSLAVDFQGYGETAWLAWLSGAPQRWGIVYGRGRRWAYTRWVARDKLLHHVDRGLFLLHQCGLGPGRRQNEFVLPDHALASARQFFADAGLDPAKPTLFVQPLTSSPQKNWPLDRYLAVAGHWRQQGWQVLFGGGPQDRPALEPARQTGFLVSAGVPLLVTGGLLKLSTLVLGGDTGMTHLAVALGRRVVMVMKSIAPGSPYPYQHPDWTVVPPDGRDMFAIESGMVIAACTRAIHEQTGRVSC